MTGPEHYQEAERLLAIPVSTEPEDQGAVIALHLAAQVHATLAVVAATAEPWADSTNDQGGYVHHAWVEALS